jgi:hypothetical protein
VACIPIDRSHIRRHRNQVCTSSFLGVASFLNSPILDHITIYRKITRRWQLLSALARLDTPNSDTDCTNNNQGSARNRQQQKAAHPLWTKPQTSAAFYPAILSHKGPTTKHVRAKHVNREPRLFRIQLADKNPDYNCTIWEAGRATSASPRFFKRIRIGDPWC